MNDRPINIPTSGDNEEIKALLAENQKILTEIQVQVEKTKKYIRAGRIISFIYLILIVAPLLFAIFYLPPLLKNYLGPYQELLGTTPMTGGLDTNSVNDLLNQFQQQ
ncbi:MAG TPA: hypothetical protein P5267_00060 [Patescibacteria group bacterium]|nr:hypothetical protein [Patescibacteria group bacterium]